ncbi:MAG: hypothetical protein GX479_03630 [Bacteroidales bacterium]|nr:hypothetical protein [Bacteroidales bacterium]
MHCFFLGHTAFQLFFREVAFSFQRFDLTVFNEIDQRIEIGCVFTVLIAISDLSRADVDQPLDNGFFSFLDFLLKFDRCLYASPAKET